LTSHFSWPSDELKGDNEFMLEAVKQELIGDKGVVLEARKPAGYLLKHASEELRGQQGGCAGGCDEGWLDRLCASAYF
jgi:hypothetical protein